MKQRDSWFDNAKAVLTILVVVGHFCGGCTGRQVDWFAWVYNYIYLFHMPVFLMISGRFSKKRVEGHCYADVARKVFAPYLVLTACMSLLRAALGLDVAYDSVLSPYFGLWYLLAIGLYQIFTSRRFVNRWWYFLLAAALVFIAGFQDAPLYGKFTKIIYFYPFFLLGYYSNNWNLEKLRTRTAAVLGWAYFILLGIVTVCGGELFDKHLMQMDTVFAEISAQGVGVSFLLFVFRMFAGFCGFFALLSVCTAKKLAITYIGKYSLYVYGVHIFIVYAMREILEKNNWLYLLRTGIRPELYLLGAVALCFVLASRPMRRWESYFLEPWAKLP